MKTPRVQNLLAIALVFGLSFTSANLFAQQGAAAGRVPVGHPVPFWSHPPAFPNGPLPNIKQPLKSGGVTVVQSFDGIDFLGSNCGCLPPDTNAAVGNGYVAEAVNIQFRVWTTSGTQVLDEPLDTLFGAPTGGDPDVVFDDISNRWYINAFDSSDSGLFLAVSNDANPLDGFVTYDLTNVNGFPDYAKSGFNKDAIFIAYNNFGTGNGDAEIAAIDKNALLSGTLTYYISDPQPQFRAMPPARMHGDTTGGTEWFASTDGSDTGGSSMRVTMMTNYLSNSPVFTYTSVPVTTYQAATSANQPGGTITVFPNTTTYQVHYRNGHLLTAMASALSGDGFVYPKALIYDFNVSSGTPTLTREIDLDHGSGVAMQMPSVDLNKNGDYGLTWFESSTTEYMTMWVDGLNTKKSFKNPFGLATVVTASTGFMTYNFRIGDYSSIVLDPADDLTFWAANEYIGTNGANDIWSTHIAAFTVPKK